MSSKAYLPLLMHVSSRHQGRLTTDTGELHDDLKTQFPSHIALGERRQQNGNIGKKRRDCGRDIAIW